MADQSRQVKIAAARKKLEEFKQKSAPPPSSAGPKKKRKGKAGKQLDVSTPDRHSPDNIDSILKVMSITNGVALPSFANSKSCNQDANCHDNGTDENRPLSSTESLRQLSQQLNGLLSESSTTYVNGDSAPSPVNEKELEARNQELVAALDSSKLTNSQLSTQLQQLTQQSQELSDTLQKERKDFEQKFVKEQGAMREQLQVHIQTIGILVSEKTELQTALSYTQQAARQKTAEADELNNRLQASKQRVSELERTLSTVSTQQKQHDKHNKELEKERDSLRLEVFRLNNSNEEARQQLSEVGEQLRLRVGENSSLTLELDDLRRRLEMADVMLQQFSNESGPPTANQQVQLLLEEKHQLETHAAQLNESVAQLQTERDQYALQMQEDGRVWKEKTEQLLSQVTLLSEERDTTSVQVHELEAQIQELKNAAVVLHEQHQQQSAVAPPSGPSETEQALQEALSTAQQERDALGLQYQAQVRDNEQLSRLCQEQEARMEELEREAQVAAGETQDRRRILEDAQSDKATISRALAQNRELKDQLAELQNGFVKLTNENMELTSAIQSEQHVKKELARRMGQLAEDLHNAKEQLQERSVEAVSVCEQRDQYALHLQQYSSGYQQLAQEREELHKRILQQAQLMDRLQHDEVQGKVQLEQSTLQLQQAQERLNQLARDNEELKSEVQELLNSSMLASTSRDQGDGLESQAAPAPEGAEKSAIAIPEDFDSREEMEEFLQTVLVRVERERDELQRQLEEERRLHHTALQQQQAAVLSQQQQGAVMAQQQQQQLQQLESVTTGPSVTVSGPGESGSVPAEVHEALRVAMEQLQERFTSLMQEKADLRERLEELEHRCIQLSGETDTIGEYIALYQNQRAIMKQRHIEKEQYINMLAQDKEEMKAKLSELQELVMRLVGERNEWYTRYVSAVNGTHEPHDPHGMETQQDEPQRRMELNAVDGPESMDMSTAVPPDPTAAQATMELGTDDQHHHTSSPEQEGAADGQVQCETAATTNAPAAGAGTGTLRPVEDGTARQIMQLLQEIQNPQSRPPPPFLGENPCIPFFYRPDQNDEVKILVV
ncbi:golgin subfamily A member 2 isoform X3 [Engraulis encrasicolus]|uniref:golgin subfamily A member 2 isoform X3 n=1 Tax=Engraulis encrasicolus TaxID=184585 RepID=UPI002FD2F52B